MKTAHSNYISNDARCLCYSALAAVAAGQMRLVAMDRRFQPEAVPADIQFFRRITNAVRELGIQSPAQLIRDARKIGGGL